MNKIQTFMLLLFCTSIIANAVDIDGKIKFVKLENGYSVDAHNDEPFPIYLYIDFDLVSYIPSAELPAIIKLPVGTSKNIMQLEQEKERGRVSYSVEYSFMLADPETTFSDDYLYYLLYEHGTVYRVGQAWNGTFSHYGQHTYAVDFDMDEGIAVYAARGGTVVSIKEDSNIGGASASYANHTNYILIRHADNTFANYVHLKQGGALVEKGQRVEAGDKIGLSGATGVATGPHLHFDVRVYGDDGLLSSISFRF